MKSYGKTDVGLLRTVNQDYIYFSDETVGKFPNLYIVADGMGGHKAGDVASRYAVEQFTSFVKESNSKNYIAVMDEGITKSNRELVDLAKTSADYEGMGTTFVVATVVEDTLYVSNVGDSRLYIINDDKIKQITRDHSLVEEMVSMGELDRKSARIHEKKNIITRAVGAEENVVADLFEIEYHKGDIILMCTDGLTNMVDDETILKIVTSSKNMEVVVTKLIDEANNNGGKDNISVVLVKPE